MEHRNKVRKIAIIGGGNIGMELFKELTGDNTADHIAVWNNTPKEGDEFKALQLAADQANLARGKYHTTSQFGFHTGEAGLADALRDADIVVVTAGAKRVGKETRAELATKNLPFIDKVAEVSVKEAPNATYVIATNPVDTLTERFQNISQIDRNRIVGLSGVLDKSRLVQSICFQAGVSPDRVTTDFDVLDVLGQHGPKMVPVLGKCKIDGNHISEVLSQSQIAEIKEACVKGGDRMVGLLGTSDHIAPAAALGVMVRNIAAARSGNDMVEPVTCSSNIEGKDGCKQVYAGFPVIFKDDGSYGSYSAGNSLLYGLTEETAAFNASLAECRSEAARLPETSQATAFSFNARSFALSA